MNTRIEAHDAASTAAMGRAAGILWLLCIVTSMYSFVVTSRMVVATDAAATSANVLGNESLFRAASVTNLLSGVFYLGVTALLFYLLKPVSRALALTAACFGTAGVAIGAVAYLAPFLALSLLRKGQPTALNVDQLQGLALFTLTKPIEVAFSVGMVFFGVQCVIVGTLIARSTFLPRLIGILLAVGGTSYIVVSLITLLAPQWGPRFVAVVLPAALIGEGSLTLWLLVRSVNVQRWQEQAQAAAA